MKNMLDYKAIAALQAVIETQSFEAAAAKLFLTQSAVSQRIKGLESDYGKPVLVRTLPYGPTALGETLLGHFKRVQLLEQNLKIGLDSKLKEQISIAISRDSLETWFQVVINQLGEDLNYRLEIIADDQEITLEYLRKGLVSACVATSPKMITGCKNIFLGYLDYVLVCSPAFKQRYFSQKKGIKEALLLAPTLIFDNKDDLTKRYLKHFFHINEPISNYHTIPSVEGFRQFVLQGYAYALIPRIDVEQDLKQKALVNLFPDKVWEMPMYLHTWEVETQVYKLFNQKVVKIANRILRKNPHDACN